MAPPRPPLVVRREAARRAARARIAARITRPLPAGLRTVELTSRLPVARVVRASVPVGISIVLHGALVGAAFAARGEPEDRRPPPLVVEMRERPAPPPPLEPAPKAEIPAPEPEKIARPEPPRREPRPPKPPPTAEPPPSTPPAAAPPPRIVGINLDSTTAGGDGPGFAVGNTRAGETASTARDPRKVPPVGVAAPTAPPANRVAQNVPTAGVSYVMPKRTRPSSPPYPETLKAQGIEADVTVLVRLDATGAVIAVEIARSSGHPEMDAAARTAARSESFTPARRAGVAIPYSLTFTYRFRLESP